MSNSLLEHFLFECCLVYVHRFYPKFRIGRIKNWSNIVLIVHELKRTVSLKKGKEKKKNYPSISLWLPEEKNDTHKRDRVIHMRENLIIL